MKPNPKSNKNWVTRRDEAVEVGASWARDWLKKYKEPTREGTPKGDPIGFSKKKMLCALLMILHGSIGLREIGKLCGTSEGMIRLWRHQDPAFNRTADQACRDFARHIVDTIGHDFVDTAWQGTRLQIAGLGFYPWRRLVDLLPFYSLQVLDNFQKEFFNEVRIEPRHHMVLGPELQESLAFRRDPEDTKWSRDRGVLNCIKVQVHFLITNLTRPELRKELTDEKTVQIGKDLEQIINKYLDLLAG